MKLNRNIKIFINYFLGPLLFLWLSWSIYQQVKHQPHIESTWQNIRESMSGKRILLLIAVIILMIVNWGIEALKWKISVKPIQEVSWFRSLKAVFSGVSFSVSTPNRIGEYLGRVLYMDEGNRLRTISTTIVGSLSQLIITLLAGCVGLFVLKNKILSAELLSPAWMNIIIYGTITVTIILLLFYYRLSFIVRWAEKLPKNKKFNYLVAAIETFDTNLLSRLLFLSLIRYSVFLLQYYLLFTFFDVNISWWDSLWSVTVSFFVMAVIPTIAIAELAQRGKVVTTITGLFSSNLLGMTFATAGIWLINLIIPAIIGSLLILRIKISSNLKK